MQRYGGEVGERRQIRRQNKYNKNKKDYHHRVCPVEANKNNFILTPCTRLGSSRVYSMRLKRGKTWYGVAERFEFDM
jgi:hypothetical protein